METNDVDDLTDMLLQQVCECMFHGAHMDTIMGQAENPVFEAFLAGEVDFISFVQLDPIRAHGTTAHSALTQGTVFCDMRSPSDENDQDITPRSPTAFSVGSGTSDRSPMSPVFTSHFDDLPPPQPPLSSNITSLANAARSVAKFVALQSTPRSQFHIVAGWPALSQPIKRLLILKSSAPGEVIQDVRDVIIQLFYHPPLEAVAQLLANFGCGPAAESLENLAGEEHAAAARGYMAPLQPWLIQGSDPTDDDLAGYFDQWTRVLQHVDPLNRGDANSLPDGPQAELDEWQAFCLRADSLILDLEQYTVHTAVEMCHDEACIAAFNASVKAFHNRLKEIRDAYKNLAVVQPHLKPLYGTETEIVTTSLPHLCRNLLFLRQLSTHYKSAKNISRLLTRVSHQLVVHLRMSIDVVEDSSTLWQRAKTEEGLERIIEWCQQVPSVEQLYRTSLWDGQNANPDLSMMDIIAPLEAFSRRVTQLQRIFMTLRELNQLNRWQIPEAGSLIGRFHKILSKFQGTGMDVFDVGNPEAAAAFEELHHAMLGLDNALRVLINNAFERTTDANKSSLLIKTFSNILAPSITAKKHLVILEFFTAEMVKTHKLFQQTCDKPPAFRNALPVASAVGWARLLRKRVEDESKEVLEREYPESGWKLVKQARLEFDRVRVVLNDYEVQHIEKWGAAVVEGMAMLKKPPILAWGEEGLALVIDQSFFRTLMAMRQLQGLGADIPANIRSSLDLITATKNNVSMLEGLTKQYTKILSDMPPHLRYAFAPLINDVTAKLHPGLTGIITWMPIIVEPFIKSVDRAINKLVWVLDQVKVVLRDWLAHACACASQADLIDLSGLPYRVNDFTEAQLEHIKKVPHLVKIWNNLVEQGCLTMLDFLPKSSKSTKSKLFKHYHSQFCNEVIAATVKSLTTLQGLVSDYNSAFLVDRQQPLFILELQVSPNGIDVNPPVSKVHEAVVQCCAGIIGITRTLRPWTSQPECSVFNKVRNSKEILKCLFMVTGLCSELAPRIERYVKRYENFEPLWRLNKEKECARFASRTPRPTLEAYKEVIEVYLGMVADIDALPDTSLVLPFQLDLKQFKSTLRTHAREWVHCYARPLHLSAKERLQKLSVQFEGLEKRIDTSNASTASLGSIIVALNEHRHLSASLNHLINPIIEDYAFVQTLDYPLPSNEVYQVADLKYRWKTLQKLAGQSLVYVHKVQSFHRRDLIVDIQGFRIEVIVFNNRFQDFVRGLDKPGTKPKDVLKELSTHRKALNILCDRCFRQHDDAVMFAIPFSRNPMLEACDRLSRELRALYSLKISVDEEHQVFSETLWGNLNTAAFERSLTQLDKEYHALPSSLAERAVYRKVGATITELLAHIPLFKMLHQPCILERHWRQLMNLCSHQWSLAPGVFKTGDLLAAGLVAVRDSVEGLLMSATKEANIEAQLDEIITPWHTRNFCFTEHPKGWGNVFDTLDAHAVKDMLEENQLQLANLLSSGYIDAFRADATTWMYKLATTAEALALVLEIQKVWLYIECMFANRNIVAQMPDDGGKFAMIDEQWQKITARAKMSESIVQFCNATDLAVLPTFRHHLYECQLKLQRFLDEKRSGFPRLYLISDASLMDILTAAARPKALSTMLGDVFEGLTTLQIESDVIPGTDRIASEITALHLTNDDVPIRLSQPVKCEGSFERWLSALRPAIQSSMLGLLKANAGDLLAGNIPEHAQIVKDLPYQLNMLLLWLHWTMDVSQFLVAQKGEQRKADCTRRWRGLLQQLLEMRPVQSASATAARTSLMTWVAYLADCWQQGNVLKNKDMLSTQWGWVRLMRMYWRTDGNACVVRVVDTELTYGFDNLGAHTRMVITPTVERCFIMIFHALQVHACGAIIGPATSGKTEVVKELGTICGRFVTIYPCSESSSVQSLTCMLRGITLSGDWGCLDNLHKVDKAVLSVIATQINCILSAQKKRKTEFTFTDGTPIRLQGSVGIFMTILADRGMHEGIPENLRSLFREASLPLPDRREIVRMKLLAIGGRNTRELAYKLDLLFSLLQWRFCTSQQDYQFNLRTAMAVVRRFEAYIDGQPSVEEEEDTGDIFAKAGAAMLQQSPHHMPMVWAIYHVVYPALLPADSNAFLEIFSAVFNCDAAQLYPNESVFADHLTHQQQGPHGCELTKAWTTKARQLYLTTKHDLACVILGPPGSGKTTLFKAMLHCLSTVGECIQREYRFHPLSVTAAQLYGHLNERGGWVTGLLPRVWQLTSEAEAKWIVLDAPLGGAWMDTLTPLFDHTLMLGDGERLQLQVSPRPIHCIFETTQLDAMTPSLASRLSIFHVAGDEIPMARIVSRHIFRHVATHASELEGLSHGVLTQLDQLFTNHALPLYKLLQTELPAELVPVTACHILIPTATLCCKVLQGLRLGKDSDLLCERVFWSHIASAFGALCLGRVRHVAQNYITKHARIDAVPDGPIFDYYMNSSDGEFYDIEPSVYEGANGKAAFFPSRTGEALMKHMQLVLKCNIPLMCVGKQGSGKTRVVTSLLQRLAEADAASSHLRIGLWQSTCTTALRTRIHSKVRKQVGRMYGPGFGERLYIFLDDIALPARDPSGHSPTAELLRQMIEFKGDWSSDATAQWRHFNRITFVGAMDVDAANPMPSRVRRHFAMTYYPLLEFEQLRYIAVNVYPTLDELLIRPTWELWSACCEEAASVDEAQRCPMVFTQRDLFHIFAGLALVPQYESSVPLWKHECRRVLSDRLDSPRVIAWFESYLANLVVTISAAKQQRDGVRDDEEAFENFYFVAAKSGSSTPGKALSPETSPRAGLFTAIQSTWSLLGTALGHNPHSTTASMRRQPRSESTDVFGGGGGGRGGSDAPDILRAPSLGPRASRASRIISRHSEQSGATGVDRVRLYFLQSSRRRAGEYQSYTHSELMKVCIDALGQLRGERMKNFVIFEAIYAHVARVARVLSTATCVGLVLVGERACGKRSVCKIAAKVLGMEFGEINATPGAAAATAFVRYIQMSASKGQLALYIPEDVQLSPTATLLEALQNLFGDGELPPGMYDGWDNLPEIVAQEMANAKDSAEEPSISACVREAVVTNLRPIIGVVPTTFASAAFAQRYRPLLSQCLLCWMLPWPRVGVGAVFSELVAPALCHNARDSLAYDDTQQRGAAGKLACAMHFAASALLNPSAFSTSPAPAAAAPADSETAGERMGSCHPGAGLVTTVTVRRFLQVFDKLYCTKLAKAMAYAKQAHICMRRYAEASNDVTRILGMVGQNEKQSRDTQQQQAVHMSELYAINSQVQEKKQRLLALREELASRAAVVEKYRSVLQSEVKLSQPALDTGKRICDAVTNQDLKFLRSIPFPIPVVRKVFDLLLILLQHPLSEVRLDESSSKTRPVMGDSWLPSGRALAHRADLMAVVHHFHALCRDYINDETVEFLEAYLTCDDELDSVSKMKKLCGNIGGLVQWVKVMIEYHNMTKTVESKITQVREAEADMRAANLRLQRAQENFEVLSVDVRKIESQMEEQRTLQQQYEEEAIRLKLQANAAASLVDCLHNEHEQWLEVSAQHQTRLARLSSECLFDAAVFTYTSHLAAEDRYRVIQAIHETVPQEGFKPLPECFEALTAHEGTEECVNLALHRLPEIPQYTLNARIVHYMTSVNKFCLLVDPEQVGLQWLLEYKRQNSPDRPARVVSVSTQGLADELIDCMEGGVPVIITDVTADLDEDFNQLVYGRWNSEDAAPSATINGRSREILPGFELYMICGRPDELSVSESMLQYVVLVDFRPPMAGTQDMILRCLLATERADLEEARVELLESKTENHAKIIGLKKALMDALSTVSTETVPLIENEDIITSMFDISRAESDARKQCSRAEAALAKIQNLRKEYIGIPQAACQVLQQAEVWEVMNPYLSLSAQQVLRFVEQSLQLAERHDIPAKRVALVVGAFHYLIFNYFVRTLFPERRMAFRMQFLARFGESSMISSDACDLLDAIPFFNLAGRPADLAAAEDVYEKATIEAGRTVTYHYPHWLPYAMRCRCAFVMDHWPLYRRVLFNLERDRDDWRRWVESDDPDSMTLPREYFGQLTDFHYLLSIFCFHNDHFPKAVATFIQSAEGSFVSTATRLVPTDAIQYALPLVPVLFVTRPGACVGDQVEAAARRAGAKLQVLGVGSGSTAAAIAAIHTALELGQWVLLQNVHCDPVFLRVLRDLLDAHQQRAAHNQDALDGQVDISPAADRGPYVDDAMLARVKKDARLVFSCEETAQLPPWLLRNCTTAALCQPDSVKEGMHAIIDTLATDVFTSFKRPEFKTLLYSICIILSLLQQKTAHPLGGFSNAYTFSLSHILSLNMFLHNYFSIIGDWGNRCKPVNFDCIVYMIGEGFLGGQVHGLRDRRILSACMATAFRHLRTLPTTHKGRMELVAGYEASWNVSIDDIDTMIAALPETDTLRALSFACERGKGGGLGGAHAEKDGGKDVSMAHGRHGTPTAPKKPKGLSKGRNARKHYGHYSDDIRQQSSSALSAGGKHKGGFVDGMDWEGTDAGMKEEQRQVLMRNAVPLWTPISTNVAADGTLTTPVVDILDGAMGMLKRDFAFLQEAVRYRDGDRLLTTPLLGFLCREAHALRAMHAEVWTSIGKVLTELRNGPNPIEPPPPTHAQMQHELERGFIPVQWMSLFPRRIHPINALDFQEYIRVQYQQLQAWVLQILSGGGWQYSHGFWLGGLLDARGFFVAFLAQSSRVSRTPFHQIRLTTTVVEPEELAQGKERTCLYGFMLRGAVYDSERRRASASFTSDLTPQHYLILQVAGEPGEFSLDTQSARAAARPKGGVYSCPVHDSQTREDASLLFYVPLATQDPDLLTSIGASLHIE